MTAPMIMTKGRVQNVWAVLQVFVFFSQSHSDFKSQLKIDTAVMTWCLQLCVELFEKFEGAPPSFYTEYKLTQQHNIHCGTLQLLCVILKGRTINKQQKTVVESKKIDWTDLLYTVQVYSIQ